MSNESAGAGRAPGRRKPKRVERLADEAVEIAEYHRRMKKEFYERDARRREQGGEGEQPKRRPRYRGVSR